MLNFKRIAMKKLEQNEKYIDDIIKELPLSGYTSRFREELLEHMEDIEEDLESGNKNIEEKTIKNIGSKDELVKEYNEFHIFCFSKFWIVKTLFYSFLSLPILFITSAAIVLATSMMFAVSTGGFALLLIPIAYKVNCLLYKFIAIQLAPYCHDKERRKTILAILLVPAFLFLFLRYFSTTNYASSENWWQNLIDKLSLSLSFLVAAIFIYFSAAKNFKAAYQKKENTKDTSKLIYLLPLFFFIGFATNLASGFFDALKALPQPFNFILQIFFLPGDIIYSGLSILDLVIYETIESIFATLFNTVIAQEIMTLFIAFIGLCGLWLFVSSSKVKNKIPDRWMESLGLIIFFNSIFGLTYFITSKVKEPEIQWQVPAVNISEKIERQELGWFYPFVPNFEISDVMDAYYPDLYRIDIQDNGFNISHVDRYNYWVETEKISSLSDLKIKKQGEYIEPKQEMLTEAQYFKMMEESEKNPKPQLRTGFSCTDKDGKSISLEGAEYTSSMQECTDVKYYGKDIWKSSSGQVYILYITQSKDNNWAVISVQRNYAVFVYLVDLRSMK